MRKGEKGRGDNSAFILSRLDFSLVCIERLTGHNFSMDMRFRRSDLLK